MRNGDDLMRATGGEFWVGCDLGARVDRSAIVVVEGLVLDITTYHGEPNGTQWAYRNGRQVQVPTYANVTHERKAAFQVAEIIRLDQGAPHSETLAALIDVHRRYRPRFSHFDETGLGIGFNEYIRNAYMQGQFDQRPRGVTFTAQNKFDVIGALDRLVDEGRINVPDQPGADKLRQELTDYRYRYTAAGNITTGSATEAAHDDLVIATALAVFPVARRREPSVSGTFGFHSSQGCRIVSRNEFRPATPKEEMQ